MHKNAAARTRAEQIESSIEIFRFLTSTIEDWDRLAIPASFHRKEALAKAVEFESKHPDLLDLMTVLRDFRTEYARVFVHAEMEIDL
jgi:hypothetical protein